MQASACFVRTLVVLILGFSAMACGQATGTFVVLKFDGKVPAGKSIRSVEVNLQLGLRTDTTTFLAPNGGAIILPADATLEIGSGDGELSILARALADDQSTLATGSTSGHVSAGQTTKIPVPLGSLGSDAGSVGPADALQDTFVAGKDAAVDDPIAAPHDAGMADNFLATADVGILVTDTYDAGATGVGGTGAGGAGGTGGSGGVSTGGVAGGGNSGGFQLTLAVETLDFGPVPLGGVSAPQALTVTNLGSDVAASFTYFVSDGHRFFVLQDLCNGVRLKPRDSCTLLFIFKPDSIGTIQTYGTLNPSQGPPVSYYLSGTGSGGTPLLTLSPSSVDFQNVNVGIAPAVPFTVTNNGAQDSGALKILINPSDTFQITADHCTGLTLGSLGQCTFLLAFRPQGLGSVSGILAVQSASGLLAVASATGVGQDRVQLTVQFAGTGGGSVAGSGLSCQSNVPCAVGIVRTSSSSLPKVDLSARPDSNSRFACWKGDCSGTANCSLLMDGVKSVTATFDTISVPAP